MEENGVFNRLVMALPMDDRKSLLEKLNAQSGDSDQFLYDDRGIPDSGADIMDIKNRYDALPWYTRLFFWIIGLFAGKTPLQIFQGQQVAQIGRLIEEQSPGIYDYEHDQLLPAFYKAVTDLKDSARFFYDALDMSVNRDKGAFYVFLASLEMEDIHRLLLEGTDPVKVAEKHVGASDLVLRQLGTQAMEEGIAAIGDDRRAVMYYNARTLHCLKELSSFLFDRLLVSFASRSGEWPGKVCSAHLVNNYLRNLNNILYSLKETPPMTLLESLFIFILQDKSETPGFDMEAEMTLLLGQAQKALGVIRNFNKTVPLNRILRCAERDMTILPKAISGGEDWFSMYKEYWKRTVDEQFNDYNRNHRRRELLEDFQDFFKGAELQTLAGAESDFSSSLDHNSVGIPFRGAFCLSFLRTFHSVLLVPELNLVLRPILIDGEFFKKENLTEFTDAYNDLFKVDEIIRHFEGDISIKGDLGKRYIAAKMDMSSLLVKRHKVQLVEDEASDEAKKIIDRVGDAMDLMGKVLEGILTKAPDGKFDTLTNLADMSGNTDTFAQSVTNTIKTLSQARKLMHKISIMEAGR
ncbi:DUF5312 family protein [Treponema primitia]|uniref:DUF5312 family protein n=1 Tax=Treponema primitia TaxID=88058 RepID=UPI0002554C6A|nr:DUF5312 family protein [Treponema primitia]